MRQLLLNCVCRHVCQLRRLGDRLRNGIPTHFTPDNVAAGITMVIMWPWRTAVLRTCDNLTFRLQGARRRCTHISGKLQPPCASYLLSIVVNTVSIHGCSHRYLQVPCSSHSVVHSLGTSWYCVGPIAWLVNAATGMPTYCSLHRDRVSRQRRSLTFRFLGCEQDGPCDSTVPDRMPVCSALQHVAT